MNPINQLNMASYDFLNLWKQKEKALQNQSYSPQAREKIAEEIRIMETFYDQVEKIIQAQHEASVYLRVIHQAEKKVLTQGDAILKDITMDLRAKINEYEKEIIDQRKLT